MVWRYLPCVRAVERQRFPIGSGETGQPPLRGQGSGATVLERTATLSAGHQTADNAAARALSCVSHASRAATASPVRAAEIATTTAAAGGPWPSKTRASPGSPTRTPARTSSPTANAVTVEAANARASIPGGPRRNGHPDQRPRTGHSALVGRGQPHDTRWRSPGRGHTNTTTSSSNGTSVNCTVPSGFVAA